MQRTGLILAALPAIAMLIAANGKATEFSAIGQMTDGPGLDAPLEEHVAALHDAWGLCETDHCPYDLTGDGMVGMDDLIALLDGALPALDPTDRLKPSPDGEPRAVISDYDWHTGKHDGPHETASRVATSTTVARPGAPWLRLRIADYDLGKNSYLKFSSLDGELTQRLDSRSLPQWSNHTAFFAADELTIKLVAARGDADVFVVFESVIEGIRGVHGEHNDGPTHVSICGFNDTRVPSSVLSRGRFRLGNNVWATGFPVANGAIATAGHSVPSNSNSIIEFAFPNSDPSDGTPIPPHPNHQYPLDVTNRVFEENGVGADWALIGVHPNSNTGLTPHQAYGFVPVSLALPSSGSTIRITGCGVDEDPLEHNRIVQTATGPFNGEEPSANGLAHHYRVDTEPGNSGSPVVYQTHGVAIGIHAQGGCGTFTGTNKGTSTFYAPLRNAMNNFQGSGTVFVDGNHPSPDGSPGEIFAPYASVSAAVGNVPSGGTLSIAAGTYSETVTISTAMTISAPVGTVTIGQ